MNPPEPQPTSEFPLVHVVRQPRAASPAGPPALIMLHGRGADEYDLIGMAEALDPRLMVVSVRAPFVLGPGYHWYELHDIGAPEPRSFAESLARLRQFVEDVVPRYGIDPARLYMLGFSQGAMMTGAVALTEPDRLAGALLLSGYLPLHAGLPIERERLAELPFFVAHGTQDPVIPIKFGRENEAFLEEVGADLTYREYPIAHQVGRDELEDIAFWLTDDLDELGSSEDRPE